MDTYSLLREFADSWFLIAMLVFFLGCCVWAFRPGSRAIHDDAARVVFRGDEDRPASDEPEEPR
jgi:cytochrome c oxidase cbb3-type subunit 4